MYLMNIRLRAKLNPVDNKWYLDIIPPVYMNGAVVIQEGALYFPTPYSSQEEAYEVGRTYLKYIGITKEIIDNKVNYE